MIDSALNRLIKSCTVGDKVDLKQICDTIKISLRADPELNDLGRIGRDKQQKLVIWLKPSLDARSRFTLVAIAVAEFILQPDRVNKNGINYDMFALSDLHRKKHSPFMLLATRLTIPEHIIEKLVEAEELDFQAKKIREKSNRFDREAYIENSIYLPEFIKSVVRESSGKVLLDNVNYQSF